MSATKLTELLPIPDGVRKPHAYQVFGLEDGEQNHQTIKQAVKEVVTQLKAAKGDADPKIWSTAARMAQDARAVLADPAKKAQLDARFGIVAIQDDPVESTTPSATTTDPLAGILPKADPLAAMLPESNPLAPVSSNVPPDSPLSPTIAAPQGFAPSTAPVPLAQGANVDLSPPQVGSLGGEAVEQNSFSPVESPETFLHVEKPAPRRRRRSMVGTLAFLTFSLGMIALIGLLSYFLFFSTGQVAITNSDGQISISTKEVEGDAAQVSPPASPNTRERRPVDPVMGTLAGGAQPPTRNPSGLTSGGQDSIAVQPGMDEPGMTDPGMNETPPEMSEPGETEPGETEPDAPEPGASEPGASEPDASEPGESEPGMPEPGMSEPGAITDEMIAAAAEKIQDVRKLIVDANWKEMKGSADALIEMPMSEQQAAEAEALYELADLASYYRVGIERAVSELNTGDDFAVTESFRVIVVETGDDLLVVRFNERNRSFTFDEFPFSLAHKLGTFSMPDSPTSQAAKAVYQAIAPKSTEAYREEALDWLREIDGEVEGADVDRLVQTIEALFGEDA